ncbi:MAG: hypothetical protein M1833_004453 [Piccolia ochrophora]|nr:MAG: hypothetical protein M1833_004453 [Piccolia ochrophora]
MPLFTTTPLQAATYLLGVCLFSIAFLVFLNSSISFVITDLIGIKHGVGNLVGTLGFADELVALVACPAWGLLSDRIGVRAVAVFGYLIVGVSLFLFVQARNVYPQLLLARIFFSLGGAATSTMVTAILPSMSAADSSAASSSSQPSHRPSQSNRYSVSESLSSELTITPARHERSLSTRSKNTTASETAASQSASTSRLAGIVGFCTGCGALIALALFLPLPTRFSQLDGVTPGQAVADSYYTVGVLALLVSAFCFFGLRNLHGEENKGWRSLLSKGDKNEIPNPTEDAETGMSPAPKDRYGKNLLRAITLGFRDRNVGLGYLGGFVARASSVGISLFIPLFVNAYFISSGLCEGDPSKGTAEMKRQCERAYKLAAALTGISQVAALVFAPAFGYLAGRQHRFNVPLLFAAFVGVVGFIAFALLPSPEPSGDNGSPTVFVIVILLGVSQIGAIVCSLGTLGRGILGEPHSVSSRSSRASSPTLEGHERECEVNDASSEGGVPQPADESTSLLVSSTDETGPRPSLRHLKGSIAGVYSLAGGAGILLLTKLGGYLFDRLSPGAPFYMLAIFNGVLLVAGVGTGIMGGTKHNGGT